MNDYTIIGWRAWYWLDGVVVRYNSSTTRWPELPSHGVLAFVCYSKTRPYKRVMMGVSLYWHDPKTQVYGGDDTKDALIPVGLDTRWIKRGQWVEEDLFRSVQAEVAEALDAPNESVRVDKQRA